MKRFRFVITSTLSVLFGCHGVAFTNGPGSFGQGTLVPCSQSRSVFDTNGAAETFPSIDGLPVGNFVRSNFEIFVENSITTSNPPGTSRVQIQEIYSGQVDAETRSLGLRCRESTGEFADYSNTVTLPIRLRHLSNGNFDAEYRTLNFTFSSPLEVAAATADGGKNTGMAPSEFSYELIRYWSGGVTWLRRGGSTYEFQGRRFLGGRRIFAKATFRLTQ